MHQSRDIASQGTIDMGTWGPRTFVRGRIVLGRPVIPPRIFVWGHIVLGRPVTPPMRKTAEKGMKGEREWGGEEMRVIERLQEGKRFNWITFILLHSSCCIVSYCFVLYCIVSYSFHFILFYFIITHYILLCSVPSSVILSNSLFCVYVLPFLSNHSKYVIQNIYIIFDKFVTSVSFLQFANDYKLCTAVMRWRNSAGPHMFFKGNVSWDVIFNFRHEYFILN